MDGLTLLIVVGGDPLLVVGTVDFDLSLCSAISLLSLQLVGGGREGGGGLGAFGFPEDFVEFESERTRFRSCGAPPWPAPGGSSD